jgi:hypothetical protein
MMAYKVWALLPAITYLCLFLSPLAFSIFFILTSLLYGKVSKSLQGVFGNKVDAVLVLFLPLVIIFLTYELFELS